MKKERKLRRLDFDLIQAEMSVIDGELLRSIVEETGTVYSTDINWSNAGRLWQYRCSGEQQ